MPKRSRPGHQRTILHQIGITAVDDPSRRWWKHLPEITAPTLLVGGSPTSHVPQDLLVDVSKAVPDCSVVTIPVGHNVHESDPDGFVETVLDRLGADRGALAPDPSQ